MSEPFRYARRVEFGDTDAAGIVHFSNFFRYMEAAETAFLRARGLSVAFMGADGVRYGFPRVSVACDYKAPARFEDVLTIEVKAERVGIKSVTYRFDIRHGETEVAVGRMSAVFCREAAEGGIESLEMPPEVRDALTRA